MGHAAFMLAAFSVTMTAVIFADPSNLPKQLLSDDGGSVAFPQDNNDQDHQRRIAHRQRWHSTAIAYECYLHFEAWIQFAEERSPVFILDEAEKTSSCVNGPNHYRLQSLESLDHILVTNDDLLLEFECALTVEVGEEASRVSHSWGPGRNVERSFRWRYHWNFGQEAGVKAELSRLILIPVHPKRWWRMQQQLFRPCAGARSIESYLRRLGVLMHCFTTCITFLVAPSVNV